MRVLAHIHTMNDEAVIEQLLRALLNQTRPPDAILIVDNASTDGTLNRTFPDNCTVIRNEENLGTSGTVRTGLAYGLDHGFDWVWIFDADSVPESDVLEKLLAFFERLNPFDREKVCFLAALALMESGQIKEPPLNIGPGARLRHVPIDKQIAATCCDCTLWSGSLFRMASVSRIGLPRADYMLDVAEIEYGYRAKQLGLISYVVHNCVIHQDVGRSSGVAQQVYRLGPIKFALCEISPIRCYYSTRNMVNFCIYQYRPLGLGAILRGFVRSFGLTSNFAVRPYSHCRHLRACLRGIWDGVTNHMERRY